MLKIGHFSSLTQVSIKTLRYYDELGLLSPVFVDRDSGYRYYSASQLPRLHRILALKDLGFPLHSIRDALDQGITVDALQGMLMLRVVEQQCRVQEEIGRLARLKARLRLIELEGAIATDVVLKEVPPQWIASVREVIPEYRMIGALFGKLYAALGPLGSEGLGVALWHDTEYTNSDLDAEVGVYLRQAVPVHEPVKVRELSAVCAASIVHHGAFSRIAEAYQALLFWIEAGQYRPAGAARELFIRIAAPVNREDESNVTEIQVPIERLDRKED